MFERRLGVVQFVVLFALALAFAFTRSSSAPFLQLLDPQVVPSNRARARSPRRMEKEKIGRSSRDVTRQNSKKAIRPQPRLPIVFPERTRTNSAPPLVRSQTPPPRLETTKDSTFLVPPLPLHRTSNARRKIRVRDPLSPTRSIQDENQQPGSARLKRMPSDRWMSTDASESDVEDKPTPFHERNGLEFPSFGGRMSDRPVVSPVN